MITEKVFCRGFASFWQELLPMLGPYVRTQNLRGERFSEPFVSHLGTENHGTVNEMSLRLFSAANAAKVSVYALGPSEIAIAAESAVRQIREMRQLSRKPVPMPSEEAMEEAIHLAATIQTFFEDRRGDLLVSPCFPGCGLLGQCHGDVLGGAVLYELKAGDRTFRAEDIKQVICYASLNSAAQAFALESVCLLNPRRGTFVEDTFENLCFAVSGISPSELYSDVIGFLTEMTERCD